MLCGVGVQRDPGIPLMSQGSVWSAAEMQTPTLSCPYKQVSPNRLSLKFLHFPVGT